MRAERLSRPPTDISVAKENGQTDKSTVRKKNIVCVTFYPSLIVLGSEVSEAVSVVELWFVCMCVWALTDSTVARLLWYEGSGIRNV